MTTISNPHTRFKRRVRLEPIAVKIVAQRRCAAEQTAPWLRPIFDAALCGISLVFVPPWSGPFQISGRSSSSIVIVGDDDQESFGPDAFDFSSTQECLANSHGIALVACAAVPEVYRGAAAIARLGLHVTIVETRLQHEAAWVALIEAHRSHASILLALNRCRGEA